MTNRATVATLNDTIKFTSTAINLIIDISEAYVRYAVNTINTPYVCTSASIGRLRDVVQQAEPSSPFPQLAYWFTKFRFFLSPNVPPQVCLCEFIIRAALDVLIDAAKLIEGAVDVATGPSSYFYRFA